MITHFAGRAGDHNDRAMRGSAMVAAELAARLGSAPVVIGSPEPALGANWDQELAAARPALRAMSAHFDDLFRHGAFPVTALSRCAVALATLPVVARYRPDAVVVWFDAHADLNTPDSTTTGYLGGLAFSGPLGLWNSGLGQGLKPENAILCGALDIDPAEQSLIDDGVITLVEAGPGIAERLAAAIAGRPVYVHLDCDVLEPGIVPTDYLVPGGLTLSDLSSAALAIAEAGVIGLEIGEFEAGEAGESAHGVPIHPGPLLDALQPLLRMAAHSPATPTTIEAARLRPTAEMP
ncbi:arginase family protein [Micromonospora sp. WMMD1082]|uniref:arginase family protein n=1 Tax=Micromonospora sp. WMMD1082 TaxID=3016104 RepID=UPI0024175A54|nr:arginase family protein [Micromonospora sp. WMMD1082]MDG4793719.1 arginase family protein [Micromonospora sp. WMMD1082]